MAFLPGNSHGTTNNTTAVTIVAAPGASVQRMVKTITVFNNDADAATVEIQLLVTATVRVIARETLQPGESLVFGGDGEAIVLDSTAKSLRIKLSGSVFSTQLDWTSNYADYS